MIILPIISKKKIYTISFNMKVIPDERKAVIDKEILDQFITSQDEPLLKTRSQNINEALLEGVPMSSV